MDFILKRDWVRDRSRGGDRNFAGSTARVPASTPEGNSLIGPSRGLVPSPPPSHITLVGAKLLPMGDFVVGDPVGLVGDPKELENGRARDSPDACTHNHFKQKLKRAAEKEQKQKQRTENLRKLLDHQGSTISRLQEKIAIAEAHSANPVFDESPEHRKQNIPATSSQSSSSSFSTNSMDSDGRWSASAELHVQVTHRGVQCDIQMDSKMAPEAEVSERLKQLTDDREALRTDVRELLQEKRFWQDKCRMVLEEMQQLEDKAKVLMTEKSLISKNCSELSKELQCLKERCADHENCSSSLKEVERLTILADDISKERKSLQEQIEYLQKRMKSHLDRFSQLKENFQQAVKERDAAISRAESATENFQLLQADRDHWREQCSSAFSQLQQTHLFHEELGRVHMSSQHDAERFQDEILTLRTALRTQSSDIARREEEIKVWQQRANKLEADIDNVQERMKAGMAELRQQVASRDQIIQQQKQHLVKMPQIQADLATLQRQLHRTISAVSYGKPLPAEAVSQSPLLSGAALARNAEPPCSCHIKSAPSNTSKNPILTDTSTSTSENPVSMISRSTSTEAAVFVDSSTSTSDIPLWLAASLTSTLGSPIDLTEATDCSLDEFCNPNVSLLDVSVEKLSQFLQGAGDIRLKHVETQTDLAHDSADRGDIHTEKHPEKLMHYVFEAAMTEERLKLGVESQNSLESVKCQLIDSASVSVTVLAEVLNRVFDRAKPEKLSHEVETQNSHKSIKFQLIDSASASATVLAEVLDRVSDHADSERLKLEDERQTTLESMKPQLIDSASVSATVLAEVLDRVSKSEEIEVLKEGKETVASERDILKALLENETSARFAVSERLLDAERSAKRSEERMAEVRSEIEAKSFSLTAELNKERAKTTLLEKKILSCGRILSEMIFLSTCWHSVASKEANKYKQAVRVFKFVSRRLRKELRRQVKRIDGVNKTVRSNYARNPFLVRETRSVKRLRRSVGPKRMNIMKILRKRVKQAIWFSNVFKEGTDVKCGKALNVRKRSFQTVFTELKRHVTRLKSTIDRKESKLAELEGENEELRKEKSCLEQKMSTEEDRRAVRIRELTEQLMAERDSNLQMRNQMRKVFTSCRGDLEAKVVGLTKLDDKKTGVSPLRDEISRVRDDLEKERNRTMGARKEAVEFNNWFHALEDYVRNQPIASPSSQGNQDHLLDNKESETPRRGGAISKEAFPSSCPHKNGSGCCPDSCRLNRECPLCFLKTQRVNGSNGGWASRTVHLAHECARRLNQQALTHQANLASIKAAHQRELASVRDAHAVALLRLASKQDSELARVRREVRGELKATLRNEVRSNINAVVERSLAGVEHLHRTEMKKLTRSLSTPIKFRFCRPSETGQQEPGNLADLRNQISQRPYRNLDPRYDRPRFFLNRDPKYDPQIVFFAVDQNYNNLHAAGYRNQNTEWNCWVRQSSEHQNLEQGVAEARVKLWHLTRELQEERKEARRLLSVLSSQWEGLRSRQVSLKAPTDETSDLVSEVS